METFQSKLIEFYQTLSKLSWEVKKLREDFLCQQCNQINTCLGISSKGSDTKFLNEKGDFITISFSGFSCTDLLNCSTSNLPEGSNLYFTNNRAITALTGENISIFNNDSGYITEAPQDGKQYARQNATWNEVLSSGGTEIITRVLTADVTNASQTAAEIIGLSFEAEPNSTYIITGGLNIEFSNGIQAMAGIIIPSGTFSSTFYWKKNTNNDVVMSFTNNLFVVVTQSNKQGHVGVYAVVTTGATGGTVKFIHVNYAANGTVTTRAKSFIKAVKHS